jgi:glucosyl-3-phosphoglycerate synthase
MLVDIIEKYGAEVIAQVDLGVREHRNRPLDQLSLQATAIIATALRRAGINPTSINETELTRFTEDYSVERIAIETSERPPMQSILAYLDQRRDLNA